MTYERSAPEALIHRRPPQSSETGEQAVNSVHLNPQNVDQIYVCTRAPTIFLMTLQGQVGSAGLSRFARPPTSLCLAFASCCCVRCATRAIADRCREI